MPVRISNCFKKHVSCFGIDPNAPITTGITVNFASEHPRIPEPKIRNFYRSTFCFKNWVWSLSGITLKDPLLMRLEAIK